MTFPQALVVDDDEGVCEVIADALRLEGIGAVSARSARDAIKALSSSCRPSIILLDLLMPDVSGESFLPELRKHPAARGVPIVTMSASPDRLPRIAGQSDAVLGKPFDLEMLHEIIGRLCSRRAKKGLMFGIQALDGEHRLQIDLVAALITALRPSYERHVAMTILRQLLDFTKGHFASENALMQRRRFPGRAAHIREHTKCVCELEELKAGSVAGSSPLTLGAGVAVRDSIESHIRTMDRDFASYLSTQGMG